METPLRREDVEATEDSADKGVLTRLLDDQDEKERLAARAKAKPEEDAALKDTDADEPLGPKPPSPPGSPHKERDRDGTNS